MNQVNLLGYVVRDAEVSISANGIKRCSFTLAVNEIRNTDSTKTITTYVPIVAWGNYADSIYKYAKKGSRLIILGSLAIRSLQSDEGLKKTFTEVVCDKFYIAGKQAENIKSDGSTNDNDED
jgi:single-strand DNA-binding protein